MASNSAQLTASLHREGLSLSGLDSHVEDVVTNQIRITVSWHKFPQASAAKPIAALGSGQARACTPKEWERGYHPRETREFKPRSVRDGRARFGDAPAPER